MTLGAHYLRARRELLPQGLIPYAAQVDATTVKTFAGDYVKALRLGGVSFESVDDESLNQWHERLNTLWRNLAAPNVAFWSHVIRRRETTSATQEAGRDFAGRLAARYQQRVSRERLMVNELYLSIVYRPMPTAVSGTFARLMVRQPQLHRESATAAIETLDRLVETAVAVLGHYEPEILGVVSEQGKARSKLLPGNCTPCRDITSSSIDCADAAGTPITAIASAKLAMEIRSVIGLPGNGLEKPARR